MDIFYHSMPTMWKNKMIEQGFNYTDSIVEKMTDFFEKREEKKKTSVLSKKKNKKRKHNKKRKQDDTDSSVV